MGDEALSTNCTVRTASGTHYLKYNRWGDSKQRFVPFKGNPVGRKASEEVSRYRRDQARKRALENEEGGPIHRATSPQRNWRSGARKSNTPKGRQRYNPEVEEISDEEGPLSRRPSPQRLNERRRNSYREREAKVTFGHFSKNKRSRTPSPDYGHKKRLGKKQVSILHPLRKTATEASLNLVGRRRQDSDGTDSIPELENPEVQPTIRMPGYSPKSPSPTQDGKRDISVDRLSEERKAILDKIRKLDEENAELDRLLEEAASGCDSIKKGLEELPKDREVDQADQERENIQKWLADVNKARAEGGPIPDKPESQLQYREPTPDKEDPGRDTNQELDKEENLDNREDKGHTQGPPQGERPPPPIEANVIIVNQPPPQPQAPKVKEGEADLEDREEGDSDCQIVGVSPASEEPPQGEAPMAPPTSSAPKGLWRLKKSRETSVTLQLIPDVCRDAPEKEVPPTPEPAPSMENPLKNLSGNVPSGQEGNNKEKCEKQE